MNFRILASGVYYPNKKVTSNELEAAHDMPQGSIKKIFGISERRYAGPEESLSFMGCHAILSACKQADIETNSIDLIINASGTTEQPIPVTSVLMQDQLGLSSEGIPCFDVNATCISFLVGFNLALNLLQSQQYKRIAVVSSEIASMGLNWKEFHSWPLFGDGAAAFILEKGNFAKMRGYLHKTFSEGKNLCQIRAGGVRRNVRSTPLPGEEEYLFSMQGHKVYKLAAKKVPLFINQLLDQVKLTIKDIDLFVPHQASGMALAHLRKLLRIDRSRMIETYPTLGNQIAASIPTALHEAMTKGRIAKGSKVMLIGTAAGLSLAGIVFEV